MKAISAIFPGQGSQRIGMAVDFVEKYPECARLFKEASDLLGIDLLEVCNKDDGRLNRTEFSQPTLLAAEIAMFEASQKYLNNSPTYFAGHSLGEYSALVAAGAIPFLDAILIVRKRGLLMQNNNCNEAGGMIALMSENLESTDYHSCIKECGVEVANFNSSSQVVLSGTAKAIDKVTQLISQKFSEIRIVALNVSTAFHSSLMKNIEPEFHEFLMPFVEKMRMENSSHVLSNFTGNFHKPAQMISNLVRQISGSVLWQQNMNVLSQVSKEAIEFGPNRVLGKFCSNIELAVKSIFDIRSMQKCISNLA